MKKKDRGKREEKVGKGPRVSPPTLLVGLLSEKEILNHGEAWDAVLLVLAEFKETWRTGRGSAVSGWRPGRRWSLNEQDSNMVSVII